MQVNGPAAKGNGIRELPLADNIVLGEHIVTREAAVLPFARQRTNPLQRHMVGIKLTGILDIVPDPVDHGPQFITDQLIVVYGVMFPAPFNPPVMTTGIPAANDPANRNAGLCNILCKRRGI